VGNEAGIENVDGIHLAADRGGWWDLVNTIMWPFLFSCKRMDFSPLCTHVFSSVFHYVTEWKALCLATLLDVYLISLIGPKGKLNHMDCTRSPCLNIIYINLIIPRVKHTDKTDSIEQNPS
jgi:hypothetical protein